MHALNNYIYSQTTGDTVQMISKQGLPPHGDHTHLGPVDEDDAVGVEGHAGEELEQSLERVSVGMGEKEAEQTQRVPSLSGAGQLCKRGKEGEREGKERGRKE